MAEGTSASKIRNIHQRIAAITGAVGAVAKTGKNQEQKYEYITYEDVSASLRKLMETHGITVLQNTKPDGRHVTEVTSKYGAKGIHLVVDYLFTVTNVDDPSDKLEFNWQGEAIDYGDKATNKAATGAEKYFLMKLFKIGSKDDPDKESPDMGTKTSKPALVEADPNGQASNVQKSKVFALLKKLGFDKESMLAALINVYGVENPDKMTSATATDLITKLTGEVDELSNPKEAA